MMIPRMVWEMSPRMVRAGGLLLGVKIRDANAEKARCEVQDTNAGHKTQTRRATSMGLAPFFGYRGKQEKTYPAQDMSFLILVSHKGYG